MALKLAELFVRIAADLGKSFDQVTGKVDAKLQKLGSKLTQMGGALSIGVSAPIAAIGAGALKAAIDFETAFVSVRKNVDGTEKEISDLLGGIKQLTREIPATTAEITAVASAAGQLGIQTENILKFTEVAIALGKTTNLSAEEAATALAKLANITRLPETELDRLASTLLKLGKTTKANEAQITDFALRIAGAGTVVGLTQAEILGFSAALASAGIEAEAGGTAISTLIVEIASASEAGGRKLEDFAAVAGMTGEQFRKAFATNAADAVASFLEGLKGITDEGGQTFRTLQELGLDAARLRMVVLNLGNAQDSLRGTLEKGRREWEINKTLTETVGLAYGTTGSKLKLLGNELSLVAVDLGNALIPAFKDLLAIGVTFSKFLVGLIAGFTSLPGFIKTTAIATAAFAAAAGPLLIVLGQLVKTVAALRVAVLFLAANPLVALTVAVAAAVIGLGSFTFASSEASGKARELGNEVGRTAKRMDDLAGKQKKLATGEEIWKRVTDAAEENAKVLRVTGDRASFLAKEVQLYTTAIEEAAKVLPENSKELRGLAMALALVRQEQEQLAEAPQPQAMKRGGFRLPDEIIGRGAFAQAIGDEIGVAQAQLEAKSAELSEAIKRGIGQGFTDAKDFATPAIQSLGAEVQKLEDQIKELEVTGGGFAKSFTKTWNELALNLQVTGTEIAQVIGDTFKSLTEGIGQAVAQAIVFQQDLGSAVINVLKSVLAQVIASLVALGIQEVIYLITSVGAAAGKTSAQVAGYAASGAAAAGATVAFAAAALASEGGIPGAIAALALLGTIPAVAGLAGAGIVGAAAAAGTAGLAVGAIPLAAKGGLVTAPTLAVVGEAGPEVILPLDRLGSFTNMDQRGSGTVIFEVDGRVIAKATMPHGPTIIRRKIGRARAGG